MAFDALNNQVLLLKKKEKGIYIHLQPMWSIEDSLDLNLESLRVNTCTLCVYPFSFNDIIVSSCHNLYHPWCTSIWFKNHSHCKDPLCGGLVHPNWYKIFGFVEFNHKLKEKYLDLDCELARIMVAQQTSILVHFPTMGKFFSLQIWSLCGFFSCFKVMNLIERS